MQHAWKKEKKKSPELKFYLTFKKNCFYIWRYILTLNSLPIYLRPLKEKWSSIKSPGINMTKEGNQWVLAVICNILVFWHALRFSTLTRRHFDDFNRALYEPFSPFLFQTTTDFFFIPGSLIVAYISTFQSQGLSENALFRGWALATMASRGFQRQ